MPSAQAQAPTSASASVRPDGHPVRDDSLPHFDNSPAGQYTGLLHRQTLWPTIDPPRPATSSAAATVAPVSRPALIDRIDGFLMTLPLSAADKAVDSGIAAARCLGRAVSKRIDRKETGVVPEPIISRPSNAVFDPAHKSMPLPLAATDPAAVAHRDQVWLASLPPLRPARSPPSSSSGPSAVPPLPHPATANFSAVPAAVPRPGAEPRRVIESTWVALCEEVNPTGTIKHYAHGKPVPGFPRHDNATVMTKTQRKPIPTAIVTDKPLPDEPHPGSLRRRTVRNASEVLPSSHDDGGNYLYGPRVGYPTPATSAAHLHSTRSKQYDLQPSAHPDRVQPLDGRFRAENGSDDEHPVVDQFVRAGYVSTYAHQVHDGQKVDSWQVQHAVAPTSPKSEGSSEDGAAALWRKMEAESGIRMRD